MARQLFTSAFLLLGLTGWGQDLKVIADSIRTANNIPAIGYSIIQSDTILEITTVGLKRLDCSDQVNINSRFHLGSNTKAVTAFMAAKLIEEGKLKWDTRFFDLFPELLARSNKAYHHMTLSDLLSHRARVQPFTDGKEFLKLKLKGNAEAQKLQFAAFVVRQKPQRLKPDAGFIYSNSGYSLAAMMMEKATQKTYQELIHEILNEQLYLNVQLGWPNIADTNQTYGHQGERWGFKSMQCLTDTNGYKLNSLIIPAGDMNMGLADYSRFIQLFLKAMKGTDGFLKAETYNYLMFGFPSYSLGWANGVKENRYFATHDGTGGTFYCHTLISKKLDLAIIIVSNSAEEKTVNSIYVLRQLILKKYGS